MQPTFNTVVEAIGQARTTAATELADWMHATSSWNLQTAIPENIMVYLTQHWLPHHAGSSTPAGELMAAPSSLAGVKSHLSREFKLLGRTRVWYQGTQQGNPMHSMQVKTMVTGYANHATELGYQKKGAMPLTEPKMQQLLGSMHSKHSHLFDSTDLLLPLGDGMLFSLMWQTCF